MWEYVKARTTGTLKAAYELICHALIYMVWLPLVWIIHKEVGLLHIEEETLYNFLTWKDLIDTGEIMPFVVLSYSGTRAAAEAYREEVHSKKP